MRSFLASIAILLLTLTSASASTFVAKPIYCDSIDNDRGSLFGKFKEDGLQPLIGMTGISWKDDESTMVAEFYMFVNIETQQWAIVELDSQIICLLSGGSMVEFNPDKLKELLNWDY